MYKAGFARSQAAYDEAVTALFATLDELDERLSRQRYLAADRITEADIRLFTTLVRFDPVYVGHFKCNLRRLIDYPHLWPYTRELYQHPGIAPTVDFFHIKQHYYGSHEIGESDRHRAQGSADRLGPAARSGLTGPFWIAADRSSRARIGAGNRFAQLPAMRSGPLTVDPPPPI